MDKSFSVLIPDGESAYTLFVAHCLSGYSNVKIHVLSRSPWSPVRFSRFCHSYTFKQTNLSDGSLLEEVMKLISKEKIDVLLPVGTDGMTFAIANESILRNIVALVPLPDPNSFDIANNKWKLAQFLEEHQITQPPTLLVYQDEAFEKKLEDFDFPVLLKPAVSGGGRGIKRFEKYMELTEYLDHIGRLNAKEKFIVQKLIPGRGVDLNLLSRSGKLLAATVQRDLIPNNQTYAPPAAIEFIKEEKYISTIRKFVLAFGWNGYAHIDTICDENDDLRILEINARFWGSVRGSLAAGVSFPYLACLTALDIPFPFPDYEVVRYFHPNATLQEWGKSFWGKGNELNISYSESGLDFLLKDFFAEIIRANAQRFYNPDTEVQSYSL